MIRDQTVLNCFSWLVVFWIIFLINFRTIFALVVDYADIGDPEGDKDDTNYERGGLKESKDGKDQGRSEEKE